MAYTAKDFKSKKAFKEAVANGENENTALWNPGLGFPVQNGTEYVEGPQYPKAHSWYAQVTVVEGVVTKVK